MASDDISNLQLPSSEVLENPLRTSVETYSVVTASGAEPAGSPKPTGAAPNQPPAALPAGPPSWLSENLPQTASQAPPPKSISTASPSIPPLPSATDLPSTGTTAKSPAAPGLLPTFPISSTPQQPAPPASNQSSPQSALPTAPSDFGLPKSFPPSNGSSDVRTGAMPATSFPAPQSSAPAQSAPNQPSQSFNMPSNSLPSNNQPSASYQSTNSQTLNSQPANNFGAPQSNFNNTATSKCDEQRVGSNTCRAHIASQQRTGQPLSRWLAESNHVDSEARTRRSSRRTSSHFCDHRSQRRQLDCA